MARILSNLAPPYLCDRFFKHSETHSRFTRNCGMLQISFFKTFAEKRSFQYRAVKIWNDVDNNLKQAPSLYTFQKMLKEDMIKASLSNAT